MAFFVSGFIVSSAILCGLLSILFYHLRRLHLYRKATLFPGPPTVPFIGNALHFLGNTEDILNKMVELLSSYPSPFRVWLGNRLIIAVHDPDQLKEAFLSPKTIEKEDLYKFIRPWLGTGLFTAPASKWRIRRKMILPTFNPKILESFVEVFAIQSNVMVQQMEVEVDGEEFDIFNYVSFCTLDIICETAMGVTVKAQTERNPVYANAAKRIFEIIFTRIFKIWLHPEIIFHFTKLARDQRECLKYLHGVTNDVIQKKKKAVVEENDKNCNSEYADKYPTRRKAFLDLLMELSHNEDKLTDEELREEVDTMMIAGNDTTASVNCFVILMLATFPDVQEKVYKELCEIYGTDDTENIIVKKEDLQKMEYLERVIKETMRIFPVGPLLVRYVKEDIILGDYTAPKGSSIGLGIIGIHRNEKYWPDPFKFDPDRFLPEEVAKRHPFCYVPFSAGPRNCIGFRYAMMAMKTLLATVLRRYVIKKDNALPIESIKLKADVMLKPVDTITIRIERRTPKVNYI